MRRTDDVMYELLIEHDELRKNLCVIIQSKLCLFFGTNLNQSLFTFQSKVCLFFREDCQRHSTATTQFRQSLIDSIDNVWLLFCLQNLVSRLRRSETKLCSELLPCQWGVYGNDSRKRIKFHIDNSRYVLVERLEKLSVMSPR